MTWKYKSTIFTLVLLATTTAKAQSAKLDAYIREAFKSNESLQQCTSPLISPLAIVIIGGLSNSTLLSRIVTPVVYKLIPPKIAIEK